MTALSHPTAVLYGIKNCDTMKKAMHWLDAQGVAYRFHDYKKAGVPGDALASWVAEFGWETIVNRKGTTWRKLDQDQRDQMTQERAITTMMEQPSLIKRPILVVENQTLTGFNPDVWRAVVLKTPDPSPG